MSPWKSIAVLTVSCALLAACSKPASKEANATPQPAEALPPPAPAAKATPAPVAIATPTPIPEKRFAPEGVYYLIRSKSVVINDGIVGIKPGTKVIKQKDGKFLADGQKVALEPAEITNDLDIAARVGNAEAMAQVRIREAAIAAAATPPPPTPAPVKLPPPVAIPEPLPPAGGTPSPARTASNPVESLFVIPKPEDLPAASPKANAGNTMTRSGWVWEKGPDGEWKRLKPVR